MNFQLTFGNWEKQHKDAQVIRYAVFVVEQNVPVELEWDNMDAVCLHAIVYDNEGHALGTGRLLPDGHIGRMAVLDNARGKGIGGLILTALMQHARTRGDQTVVLHAQTHAEAFYRRYGFSREGNEFMEAGIMHVQMRHNFVKPASPISIS